METARKFIVSGIVQGVWFRGFVKSNAMKLGLTGWARNRRDGRVEIFAQGPEQRLDELEKQLWIGPAASRVVNVTSQPVIPDVTLEAFYIR